MEIVILRHGKPDFEPPVRVKAKELKSLISSYDSCGICDRPPVEARERAQHCNVAVCSDLPRSMISAKVLGVTPVLVSDPLFREAALPHARWGLVRLSPKLWAVFFRLIWFAGFSCNGESVAFARYRAKDAARRLVKYAAEHKSILLVGHGIINRFIAEELLSLGWVGPSNPGRGYWEYGVYRDNTT
ncbi:MAG TPA: histidine phosphatase family protein [Gammaproteobacteria bacterium]|nr:histidine phosphatase family protein [Gammaproteobacteria bacterium]